MIGTSPAKPREPPCWTVVAYLWATAQGRIVRTVLRQANHLGTCLGRSRQCVLVGGLAVVVAAGACTATPSVPPHSVRPPGPGHVSTPSTSLGSSGVAATTFGDGTWKVGSEILPGTYRTTGAKGAANTLFYRNSCYWERDGPSSGGRVTPV